MKNYITSYFESEATKLSIVGDRFKISLGQSILKNTSILVSLCNSTQLEIFQIIISLNNSVGIFNLPPKINEGIYFIQIFTQTTKKGITTSYSGLFFRKDIPICFYKGSYRFVKTVVYVNNLYLFNKIKIPSLTSKIIEPEIAILSRNITIGLLSNYQKILAIYDWVASEIYYDFDSLNNGTYVKNDHSALGVLKSRKTVCQGYTNLMVALLLAIGIPAKGLSCFSLGISTNGGWELEENLMAESNHIIPIAFYSNRWIIMDVTWDSDNEFINGKFIKKSGIKVSRKYFDTTLEFISNTHRFIK